jgi:hypothetical protein
MPSLNSLDLQLELDILIGYSLRVLADHTRLLWVRRNRSALDRLHYELHFSPYVIAIGASCIFYTSTHCSEGFDFWQLLLILNFILQRSVLMCFTPYRRYFHFFDDLVFP